MGGVAELHLGDPVILVVLVGGLIGRAAAQLLRELGEVVLRVAGAVVSGSVGAARDMALVVVQRGLVLQRAGGLIPLGRFARSYSMSVTTLRLLSVTRPIAPLAPYSYSYRGVVSAS